MNELKNSHDFWRWYCVCVCVCALTCVCNTVSNKSHVIQPHWEYSKMIFIFAILIRETQFFRTEYHHCSFLSLSLYWRHLNLVLCNTVDTNIMAQILSTSLPITLLEPMSISWLEDSQSRSPHFLNFFATTYSNCINKERLQALKENISV